MTAIEAWEKYQDRLDSTEVYDLFKIHGKDMSKQQELARFVQKRTSELERLRSNWHKLYMKEDWTWSTWENRYEVCKSEA